MKIEGTRRDILRHLKVHGQQTAGQLAARSGLTIQAIGQHLATLRADALIRPILSPRDGRDGRPSSAYELTPAGEESFPKQYQTLVLLLVDAIGDDMGAAGLHRILTSVTRARLGTFEGLIAGLALRERIELIKSVYQDADPYIEVSETADGFLITERNCPFLHVAMKRPALCSTTVSVLMHVLGVRVERVRRFQDGHGCCAFRVFSSETIPADLPIFIPEPEPRQAG